MYCEIFYNVTEIGILQPNIGNTIMEIMLHDSITEGPLKGFTFWSMLWP